MLDLDAYLERIGLAGSPDLHELHFAHATSIPFENLDSRAGIPPSLDPENLERKLVADRRGGYCFEQNLLLASALEALGAQVDLLLARVRMGDRTHVGPRTHLVLGVRLEGERWLADVGFGRQNPLEPLPFGPGGPYEHSGWRFKLATDGEELVLQADTPDGWIDLYAFPDRPVPRIDVETSNWYTATYPRSPFVTGLNVAAQRPGGRRMWLNDRTGLEFGQESPQGRHVVPLRWEQVPELIETHFGLRGAYLASQAARRDANGPGVALSAQ